MAVEVAGPTTPYITPQILTNAPTGISWRTIPSSKATPAEQLAEQLNLCARATSRINSVTNQILRANINTETLYGPDYRVTFQNSTGVVRLLLSRSPVTQILSGTIIPTASAFQGISPVALTAANFLIERPIIGVQGTSTPSGSGEGGQSVLLQPGFASWREGRGGFQITTTYISGWPHCGLTAAAAANATTINVDDCTGWAPATTGGQGAAGIFYDGNNQETATVTAASTQSGPGTLTLSTGITFGHSTGTVFTALPGSVIWAAILLAASEALTRGATATTIQTISGTGEGVAGAASHYELAYMAHELVLPYRRVV